LKSYPAIGIRRVADPDLLAAAVDDFSPTAIEERDADVRVFFATAAVRDEALAALEARFDVTAIDVPDQDWARRSQETLKPITVGRVTDAPPWAATSTFNSQLSTHSSQLSAVSPQPSPISHQPSAIDQPSAIVVIVVPSMGFGTGHHATTRLCLAALQAIDLTGRVMLDVGTGSGVLAMAADRLGAVRALGIDCDPDAVHSARENLEWNPEVHGVTFEIVDLARTTLPAADVVTANLTGALLVRSAGVLLAAVRPAGTLILSGLLAHERDEVCRAFATAPVCWEQEEDGWVGLAVKKP
jgi:ribosomal protein L11 methyltransferase